MEHTPEPFRTPPTQNPPGLPAGMVHVWQARLDVAREVVERLYAVLAPDEQARAGRFVRAVHGRRFVVARGTLRQVLAHYLDMPAQHVAFEEGPQGKPELAAPLAASGLCFNLSHAGDLLLCAVVRDRAVGIDIEEQRDSRATDAVAQRFFAPAEVAALAALPKVERVAGFYRCWTSKEAYLKGCGRGLALPLDRFVVAVGPHDAALIEPADAAQRWHLEALPVPQGYTATGAVEGAPGGWAFWKWEAT